MRITTRDIKIDNEVLKLIKIAITKKFGNFKNFSKRLDYTVHALYKKLERRKNSKTNKHYSISQEQFEKWFNLLTGDDYKWINENQVKINDKQIKKLRKEIEQKYNCKISTKCHCPSCGCVHEVNVK